MYIEPESGNDQLHPVYAQTLCEILMTFLIFEDTLAWTRSKAHVEYKIA